MERHFALPIAFAAAAHGALLFGIPGSHISKVKEQVITVIRPVILPPQDEPEIESTPEFKRAENPDPPPPEAKSRPTLRPIESSDTVVTTMPVLEPISDGDPRITLPAAPGSPSGKDLEGFVPGIIVSGDLDNSPRTRFQASPIYPHEAKAQGVTGEVLVEFVVDESGRVHDPRVVKSSNRLFEEAAVRAVSRWQFEPGRRMGRVVKFRMAVPIVFSLNE